MCYLRQLNLLLSLYPLLHLLPTLQLHLLLLTHHYLLEVVSTHHQTTQIYQ